MRALLALLMFALFGAGPAKAETPPDSTRAFTWITHHGVAWSRADDLDVASFYAVTTTDATLRRALRLDLGLHLIEAFRFEGRDEVDLAADPLIFLATAFPGVALGMLCSRCEPVAVALTYAAVPTWLPMIRPTGVWQPVPWAGIGAGYDSEYMFRAEDKGVTFRPFAGVQLDLGKWARIEGGVQQSWLWNWRRASSDLGAGWYVRVGLGTEWTGGEELPDPTPP